MSKRKTKALTARIAVPPTVARNPNRPVAWSRERASIMVSVLSNGSNDARAASGLAHALAAIYKPKLAWTEEHYARLCKTTMVGDDEAKQQRFHAVQNQVQELRGLMAMVEAFCSEADAAADTIDRVSEILRPELREVRP
jgi:hypothetical protein